MQIEPSFATIAVSAIVGLQAWILKEVVALKVVVATLTADTENMKKKLSRPVIAGLILIPFLILFAGCVSDSGRVTGATNVFNAIDNAVTVIRTNVVTREVVRYRDEVRQDPITFAFTTNTYAQTNVISETNLFAELRPAIGNTIAVGKTVSSFLPPPIGDIASTVFGIAAAVAANAVRKRNKIIQAAIMGVESSGDKQTKISIADTSSALGVATEVASLVEKFTKKP